ncbi:MAG: hypothetical protein JW917_03225 [Ignavibacteria bacterium]|nr:hypothetical protein [Ignavibacteria bacterium]
MIVLRIRFTDGHGKTQIKIITRETVFPHPMDSVLLRLNRIFDKFTG